MADGLQIRGSLPSLFSLCPLSPGLHCIADERQRKHACVCVGTCLSVEASFEKAHKEILRGKKQLEGNVVVVGKCINDL